MKKNNNKGFTLIELLAVVVILLAISVIAISSIGAAIERNKIKQNATKIAIIESTAKLYYDEHKNSLDNGDRITMYDLTSYLDEDELTDVDGNYFCGYIIVGQFRFIETKEEYCPDDVPAL